MIPSDLKPFIELRHKLHTYPEVSGNEVKTVDRIVEELERLKVADQVFRLSNNGLIAVIKGQNSGKTVLFRCELDGLPVHEESNLDYRSVYDGVSHACGHDGHMAIMVALAGSISKEPVKRGNVALLFQPAEESGMGARSVMADSVFKKIKPDFVYAMHNLPGFSQHRIILSDGGFSAASLGLKVILKGLLAHAAEPDKGINPASAISQIITEMGLLQMDHSRSGGQVLITPAHIKLGDPSFGLSPGKATLHLTLRAMHDDGLSALKEAVTGKIREISCQHALLTEFSQHEIFPASVNHIQATDMLIRVAEKLELSNEKITNPFLWSEDFAWYTREIPGAMFGIGSGVDHTNLHNPNYDFPDEILETGVKMFYGIARELLG